MERVYMMSQPVSASPSTSSAPLTARVIRSLVRPQLIYALRQAAEHPLDRLLCEEEHELVRLGLMRVWREMLIVTEHGREVLAAEPMSRNQYTSVLYRLVGF
jgi:hypothetical protein